MASDIEVHTKQVCVIEFLTVEQCALIDIQRCLLKVYRDDTVDVSTVRRWLVPYRGDEKKVYKPRPGHPCSAAMPDNEQLIHADWWSMAKELCAQLNVGCNALEKMFDNLGYRKVCARWVPWMLTQDQKNYRMKICRDLLDQYEAEGDNFLDSIVTGDEM